LSLGRKQAASQRGMKMTPTTENVSWDQSGRLITIDDVPVLQLGSDAEVNEWLQEVDADELKSVIRAIIVESNPEIDFISPEADTWANSITYR